MNELTDVQNAFLETIQESETGMACARECVDYVRALLARQETATIRRPITRTQASRALARLAKEGILAQKIRSEQGVKGMLFTGAEVYYVEVK